MNTFLHGQRFQKIKKIWLGQNMNDGLLAKLIIYFLLAGIAFLYLYPVLYMIATMVKSVEDLIDPIVQWFPREIYWTNLVYAWQGLSYSEAFLNTLLIALTCSILQVVSCAMTGYALGRLRFPGRTIVLVCTVVAFLVPVQITVIPLYTIFGGMGILNSPFVFIIPALLGQGLRGALFIIIFRQFFLTQPKALEEAAKMDGASVYRLFFRIMLPLARPAIIVVFLFSFIWYWNMYYEPSMFLTKDFQPLSLKLTMLQQELGSSTMGLAGTSTNDPLSEGPKMAAVFLIILPPLLLFIVAQRWFTEGIERTGLVE